MPAVPYKHYIDCTRLCNMAMAQVLPAVYHRHCNGLYHVCNGSGCISYVVWSVVYALWQYRLDKL